MHEADLGKEKQAALALVLLPAEKKWLRVRDVFLWRENFTNNACPCNASSRATCRTTDKLKLETLP